MKCGLKMKKIKITEQDLHNIIKDTIQNILKESIEEDNDQERVSFPIFDAMEP